MMIRDRTIMIYVQKIARDIELDESWILRTVFLVMAACTIWG